jgi:hypothetical protein
MSCVFQNIDPPPPSPPGECVPPPPRLCCGGRKHSPGGEERGKGGQYFGRRKTQLCTPPISNFLWSEGTLSASKYIDILFSCGDPSVRTTSSCLIRRSACRSRPAPAASHAASASGPERTTLRDSALCAPRLSARRNPARSWSNGCSPARVSAGIVLNFFFYTIYSQISVHLNNKSFS